MSRSRERWGWRCARHDTWRKWRDAVAAREGGGAVEFERSAASAGVENVERGKLRSIAAVLEGMQRIGQTGVAAMCG